MIRVFSHWIYWKTIPKIAFDVAFPVGCVLLAVFWAGQERQESIVTYAVIFALVMVACNAWLGLYHRSHNRTMEQTRSRAFLLWVLSVPVAYIVFSFLSIADDNQNLLIFSGLAAFFGTLVHRVNTIHRRTDALMLHRVLIFGTGAEADSVSEVLEGSDPDIRIVGFYPGISDSEVCTPGRMELSRSKSLAETAYASHADEIIIAVHERRGGILPLRELLECKLAGVNVLDLTSYFEQTLGQIRLDSLRAGWLIFGEGFRQGRGRLVVKRMFDIIAASILLVLALPVMLITALLITLEDGGSVFYQQERVGLNGRSFNIIKFRSMRADAESDGKPRWAAANDQRTTRVGHIIRKLRIDELPQLYSVLTGRMSLVGPRPERSYFVDQLARDIPFYAVRHSVKPGVTGWAQVSYRYGASVDDSIRKLQYDLYYVKNHSLFLDIVILFETVGVVLTGQGAR